MADCLNALPPEIRNHIYTYLLVSPTPIHITSPCKPTHKCGVFQPVPSYFASITRANRQVHSETLPIFFSRNIFLLSNGRYASPHIANIHALKNFVSKSAHVLDRIQHLVLQPRFPQIRSGEELWCLKGDMEEMKTIARLFVKHFKCVKSVRFEVQWTWLVSSSSHNYMAEESLREDESKAALAEVVRLVLKGRSLEEVVWLERQKAVFGKLEVLVAKVMKERKVKDSEKVKVMVETGREEEKDMRCGYWLKE